MRLTKSCKTKSLRKKNLIGTIVLIAISHNASIRLSRPRYHDQTEHRKLYSSGICAQL